MFAPAADLTVCVAGAQENDQDENNVANTSHTSIESSSSAVMTESHDPTVETMVSISPVLSSSVL